MGSLDQGMSQMPDGERNGGGVEPQEGRSRSNDLRFAGGVSAGLICSILVCGALIAPVADFGGTRSAREHGGKTVTVRLPEAPRPATPAPGPGTAPGLPSPAPVGGPLAVPAIELPVSSAPSVLSGVEPDTGGERAGVGGARAGAAAGQDGAIADAAIPRLSADSDEDGIPDQHFRAYGLPVDDPEGDADKDGVRNGDELQIHTAPNTPETRPGVSDGALDSDNDGLRNGLEARAGTKPYSADSDGDGVADGDADADGDGLKNQTEEDAGTEVDVRDSDGDA